MQAAESPYLEKKDFISPLLYKIYSFMVSLVRNRSMEVNIDNYLNEEELKIVIDKIKECDQKYTKMFNEGITHQGTTLNFSGRSHLFLPSTKQKIYNKIRKKIMDTKIIDTKISDGEKHALAALLYYYSSDIIKFGDGEALELGRTRDDPNFNIRPKEEQLDLMNNLFCGIGQRIKDRREEMVNVIAENAGKYTGDERQSSNSIPKDLIDKYLKNGGKKYKKAKTKTKRHSRKSRRHVKKSRRRSIR